MSAEASDGFVFFGASGDLAYKKIFPALYAMSRRGRLDVPVVGVSRTKWSLEEFRARAKESIEKHAKQETHAKPEKLDREALAAFLARLRYVAGDYADAKTYAAIRDQLGPSVERPTHYLAIPPSVFATVVQGLSAAGCDEGARLIVEKPFGRDLTSARDLNHRFANTFLEPIWSSHYVESVQITMAEAFGLEGRGRFYEEAGAIRDVVQNHLLQVVSILAMEPPLTSYPDSIRDEKVKVFRAIRPLRAEDVVRGQFAGYRDEDGVAPGSTVETFAALRLYIDSWRWDGVPFFIRAGKRLPVSVTEVLVTLKRPPLRHRASEETNHLRFRLSPDVTIALGARVKKPGEQMASEPVELRLVHQQQAGEMEPYERLLGEAMEGDTTMFAREDSVEAAWAIVQPVLGDVTPVHEYAPGSWGPQDAARLTAEVGGWDDPET